MMPRNEIQEVHAHVDALRRACQGFPVGEVADGKPGIEPDIIVTGDQVIGIEHTRYYRRDERGKDTMRQREAEHDEVLRLARPIVEKRLGLVDADVHVIWTDSPISRSRRQPLAEGLAGAICERLMVDGADRYGILDYDSAIATRELWEVYAVQVSPCLSRTPRWGSADASMVPDVSPATIQAIVDRKNRKVDNYVDRHRYAALWLLVVAEGDRASAFFELPPATRSHRFQARFDRVVFFDIFNRVPIDLLLA